MFVELAMSDAIGRQTGAVGGTKEGFSRDFRAQLGGTRAKHERRESRFHQMATRLPQVRQRVQRGELGGVFLQSSIAHLDEAELLLDYPERMFDLRSNPRFDSFDLVDHDVNRVVALERSTFSWTHGHMPCHSRWRVGSFIRALVTGVCKDVYFLALQQRISFDHIMRVRSRSSHRMHEPRCSIRADMRFHAKMPLIAFLGLMHLWIALATRILRRRRCGNQRGIHHGTRAQHQPPLAQQCV